MKATEFFFGFGPRLWSPGGETEYGVELLPLGGYVRITGMNPLEEVAPEDEGRTYRDKPFGQVAGGARRSATHFPLAFLIFFLVITGMGLPVSTTTLDEVQPTLDGGPPAASPPVCCLGTRSSRSNGAHAESTVLVDAITAHTQEEVTLALESSRAKRSWSK